MTGGENFWLGYLLGVLTLAGIVWGFWPRRGA